MTFYLEVAFFLFVLVFMAVKFAPVIYLQTLSVIFGKYSPQYVLFYKKINTRNPLPKAVRKNTLSSKKIFKHSPFPEAIIDDVISHLLSFKESATSKIKYLTPLDIIFDQLPFYISRKEVNRRLELPRFFTAQAFMHYMLTVYRYQVGNKETHHSKILYFINDQFVYGELVYSCLRKDQTETFKQKLLNKFHIDQTDSKEFIFCIIDKHNNLLVYDFSGHKIILRYGCLQTPLLAGIIEAAMPTYIDVNPEEEMDITGF
jgi:hypothetical protein